MADRPDGSNWVDYCDCGEYLGPIEHNPKCDCGRDHRELRCHSWWRPEKYARPWHHVYVGVLVNNQWLPEICKCGRMRMDVYLKTLDYNSRSRQYWVKVFTEVGDKVYSTDVWETKESLVKKIKLRRYHERQLRQRTVQIRQARRTGFFRALFQLIASYAFDRQ